MRKVNCVSVFLCLFITVTLYAGGGGQSSSGGGTTTISFWKGPHTDIETELWKPVIAKFEAENPGIKVEHLVTPWDTFLEQNTTAYAAGIPPDLSYLSDYYASFADAGQLENLLPYIPAGIDITKMGGYDYSLYKGELAGITLLGLDSVLFYNKDIFDAAGLKPPTTWTEFRETAKKLTTNNVWGWGGGVFAQYPQIPMTFVYQAGGTILDPAMKKLNFDTRVQQSGLQLIVDMMWTDHSTPRPNEFADDEYGNLFADGRAAMMIEQFQAKTSYLNRNPALKIGVAPVPVGPASNPNAAKANYGGFGPLNLAKASKHKAEAWKFLEWLTIKGGAADYLKANGFFSGFDNVNAAMYPAGSDPDVLTAAAQISYAFVWPPSPHVNAVNTELYLMLEKMFKRTQDVSAAYAEAQRRVQQITSE